MIEIQNFDVYNFENAMRGMRNPMNSWKNNDTYGLKIGPKDIDLAERLISAGQPNEKFLRQIFVSIDIKAPLYWWKEMDTYKVGTTSDSCSTMHKIMAKEFSINDFSCDNNSVATDMYDKLIDYLNELRQYYLDTKDKYKTQSNNPYWRALIQILPEGYNQLRTWTGSYANLRNIYQQRKSHKLTEWISFCSYIAQNAPYAEQLITYGL